MHIHLFTSSTFTAPTDCPPARAQARRGYIRIAATIGLLLWGTPAWSADDWRTQLESMNAPAQTLPVGVCAPPPKMLTGRAATSFTWAHPRPQGDALLGVTGGATGTQWAVGDMGRVLRRDTRGWRMIPLPIRDYLAGIWSAPSGALFITGYNGRVVHFNGTHWRDHPTGVSNDFNGIWGSAEDDVFTVGDRGVIFHFDGHCWKRQESGTHNLFFGVWGSGSDDVWAVGGRANVAHYDGTAWTTVDIGIPAHYVAVWGTGADNVYAVGSGGTVAHWADGRWTEEDVGTRELLRWIWGTGPDDVWVSGDGGVVRRFDGIRWLPVDTGTTGAIRGAWRAADGTHTLVGDDGLLQRGDKNGFTADRTGPSADLNAVSGRWAVGDAGTVLRRSTNGQWTPVAIPSDDTLTTVATLADGRVLVGGETSLWLYEATVWHRLDDPPAPVRAMRAWGNDALLTGERGSAMRWSGSQWQTFDTPITDTLTAVNGAGITDFWITADRGVALRYRQGAWAAYRVPGVGGLTGVSATGIVVAISGSIQQWRRGQWRSLAKPGGVALHGIMEDTSGFAWAVGDFGVVVRFPLAGDTPLHYLDRDTGQILTGVTHLDDGTVVVAGSGGAILESPRRKWTDKIK